ncbi:MAG: hypothetical protein KI792_07485 [Alphaproteobacteria bacterium]|nr:hypothetical protein [Alphaproteobacteria bacterium SS10]
MAPRFLADIVGQLSMELATNQAVSDLAYDYRAQKAVEGVLDSWGQRRFEPLINVNSSAQISIPLYAGDGLVAKVTPARYEDTTPKPFVLPAIQRKTIESDYVEYHVQMFPFVATGGLGKVDVEHMRRQLDEAGYEFANGDDRPDNLGRLPGGELVVVDHGAVQPKRGHRAQPSDANEWLTKVHQIYGPLYGPDGVKPQSEETKFDRRPAKPHLVMHYNETAAKPKQPEQAPVWQRLLGLGR